MRFVRRDTYKCVVKVTNLQTTNNWFAEKVGLPTLS